MLANKVVALKFLALPMTLIPGVLLGGLALSAWWAQEERLFIGWFMWISREF